MKSDILLYGLIIALGKTGDFLILTSRKMARESTPLDWIKEMKSGSQTWCLRTAKEIPTLK
jgi:hypothetical protein